jgi:hypothetical protein
MASWDEVKSFLKSNYNVGKDEGGTVGIEQKFTDGRSQLIFVRKASIGDSVWADIVSPIGVIPSDKMDGVLEFLEQKVVCGGIVKVGELHAIRHSMPIADLSTEEIAEPMKALAGSADAIEAVLFGSDKL